MQCRHFLNELPFVSLKLGPTSSKLLCMPAVSNDRMVLQQVVQSDDVETASWDTKMSA